MSKLGTSPEQVNTLFPPLNLKPDIHDDCSLRHGD